MDYSKSYMNFRDVGEFVNLIASNSLLPEGRLFRDGKTDFVSSIEELDSSGTIINLRRS